MYTAVVLTELSRTRILDVFALKIAGLTMDGFQLKTAQGEPLVHHVTLQLGDFDRALNSEHLLGQEIEFHLVSFAADEKVVAFGVEYKELGTCASFGSPTVRTVNKIPHVTAMINPSKGGKPFLSNKLTNWTPITPMTIKGIVEVVP